MQKEIKKLLEISEKRIAEYVEINDPWYKGHETFQNEFMGEIEKTYDEIKKNNSVYLEDELGDIFWCYISLLQSLTQEGLISDVEKVFERSYEKFSGRINHVRESDYKKGAWAEIKEIQKEQRRQEHETKYGK